MAEKFYKSIVTVEVLGNEPIEFETLEDLHYATTQGHFSGKWTTESVEVSKEEMKKLLVAQGSDENFLSNDDETDDVE